MNELCTMNIEYFVTALTTRLLCGMLCILFSTLRFLSLQGRSLVIFIKVCFLQFQAVSTLTIRKRGIKDTI